MVWNGYWSGEPRKNMKPRPQANSIKTLNIAGPRESKRTGIHQLTMELLEALDTKVREQCWSNDQSMPLRQR